MITNRSRCAISATHVSGNPGAGNAVSLLKFQINGCPSLRPVLSDEQVNCSITYEGTEQHGYTSDSAGPLTNSTILGQNVSVLHTW
jgi:hypothetical protein